jgi:hypothetical protein
MKNNSKNQSYFLTLSIILAIIGISLIILLVSMYGPKRPDTTISEDIHDRFQTTQEFLPTQTAVPTLGPTEIIPTETAENTPKSLPTHSPTPTFTPTPMWMTYDDINFSDQEIEALFTMVCDQTQIYMDPFLVRPYSPELLDSGEFNTNLNFGIAWEHLGYYGLWIHSGQSNQIGDLTAYPLQLYLENNPQGIRRNPTELFEHLQNCLIGSEMRLRQGDTLSVNRVIAAVRIPPSEVDEVSRHPMDLVPYLAENYPSTGFDQMELPGLLFYFCGRQLSGEAFNTNYSYWTQSRFIIGFMPVDGDG